MNDPKADSNDEAGILPVRYEACFPCGQSVENASGISDGDEDAASSSIYVDPLCQECQQQQQQEQREQQQEQQLLLSNPVDEDTFGQPYLPWELQDPNQALFPFLPPIMADDQYFQSLSDYEEVTYFNQPYLLQQEEQQQQLFPFIISSSEASGALELQEGQDQGNELDRFQFGNSGEAFEPLPFDFNTLPNHSFQQPLLGEAWMATHDSGVFESSQTPENPVKSEAILDAEQSPAPVTQPHAVQAASIKQRDEHVVRSEPPVHDPPPARLPATVPPRRILPSNGLQDRPAHRQLQSRTRKPLVIQSPREAAERAAKDRFLVQSRLQGVSYKEIKQRGSFTEAESTLRGRFRTLTKKKEDRVRDPKWTDIDIQLLKEAVQVLGHGQHPDTAKISWMAVSSYILDHGGTYKFGYSTCHRRWAHLESTGQLGENWYEDSWEDYDDEDDEVLPAATNGEQEDGDEAVDEHGDEMEEADDD
ncbi:hypothetical protein V8C37DRAFT_416347 [Trichoderma ceciliae]